MPRNIALEELENLAGMQGEAQDTEANLNKLQEARTQFMTQRSGDKAKFDTPNAMATAVGVGWMLGPAGGLLMGLAQGILGKQEQQRAIDAYAQDTNVANATNNIFNDELDRLAMSVTNPGDLEQLSTMQTQKDAALQMMQSASPELQQKGTELLADFSTQLNDYTVRQEEQSIAASALDTQLRRDLDLSLIHI